MKLSILAFLFVFSFTEGFSQVLEIYNSNSEIQIHPTDYLEVGVKFDYCDYIDFSGYFVSETKDSIKFDFIGAQIFKELGDSSIENKSTLADGNTYNVIAKKDIDYISIFKSTKRRKVNQNLNTINGLLLLGGLGTTINALIFVKMKKNVLIAGGVQFVVGLIGVLITNEKTRKFKIKSDPWKFKDTVVENNN